MSYTIHPSNVRRTAISGRNLIRRACTAVAFWPCLAAAITPALTPEMLKWDQCRAWAGGQDLGPAPPVALSMQLGLTDPDTGAGTWSTGPTSAEFRHFVLRFRAPVTLGTVLIGRGAMRVSIPRDGLPQPAAADKDADWESLPAGPVVTLPAIRGVTAIRLTDQNSPVAWAPSRRPSEFPPLLLLRERCASTLRIGSEEWRVHEGAPEWVGYWVRAVRPEALAVFGAPLPTRLLFLPEGMDGHPLLAPASSWTTDASLESMGDPRLVRLRDLPATMALRIATQGGSERDRPRMVPLIVLADGEALPRPAPEAPVAVAYDMPLNGFAAVHIADAQGRHVRRLMAEVKRDEGPAREGWDLRDDEGRPVPPGEYQWTLLARPPLKLTYEGTVYNAGHPPWQAPVPGGGWWMSDHSPPTAIACVGQRMVMAASGSEFGIPLIVTDLEGRKLWHGHPGALRLVSDGHAAYAVNNDAVTRIIPDDPVRRTRIHRFAYSDILPGHASGWIPGDYSGAAAKPGILCVSYNALAPPWISSSIKGDQPDPGRAFPPVIPRQVHDTALTPEEQLRSAFQIGVSSRAAFFGDAPTSGQLAHTLVLVLRTPAPLGSLVLPPGDLYAYALPAGRPLPSAFSAKAPQDTPLTDSANSAIDSLLLGAGEMDLRFSPDTWVPLHAPEENRPRILTPEAGLTTTAIAITGWGLRRLPYALALDRRYRDIAPEARLVACEGEPTPQGGWRTHRGANAPLSAGNPAVAALVWPQPTPARGYLLIGPMAWAGLDIDVWTGPADAEIDRAAVADDTHWRNVQSHRQNRSHVKYSWHTPMTLSGDFGAVEHLRALRVRVVEHPWANRTRDPAGTGGFEGLLVFQPIGNDVDLPAPLAQRITVLDLPEPEAEHPAATVRTHLALDEPGALAFAPDGMLYAACRQGVVRIADIEQQTNPPRFDSVVARDAYRSARAMAVDTNGLLYLLDGVQRQVLVFDPATGRELRRIGKPGGQLGPFDPERFTVPSAMTLDSNGKLWIVEQHFQPKRISRWTREGVFEKDFMGPTHYGGGGMMDPGDRSVINHLGMKFRMDWSDRSWKLEARLAPYSGNFFVPDRVLYAAGRRYLVGDRPRVTPFGDRGPITAICEEIDGVAVPLVLAGTLADWHRFRTDRTLQQAFQHLNAGTTAFIWCDRNRDGLAPVDEIELVEMAAGAVYVGDDLSLNFRSGHRLRPVRIPENGVPVYDVAMLERIPDINREVMVDAAGRTFVMGHTFLDRAGRILWRYPDRYASVQGSNRTPWGFYDRPAGVLSGSMNLVGHFEIGGEHLFCVNGNHGDYFAFTDDGFLAAAILGGPSGYGRRFFSMADCRPGATDLSDLRKTVEDFHGHITRAEDGNVYAIAGKNHVTIIRVDGLEALQRRTGRLTVAPDDLADTERWLAERHAAGRRARPPTVARPVPILRPPTIDGDAVTDWPPTDPLTLYERRGDDGRLHEQVIAQLAFDDRYLYVAARATDDSPMRNSATDPAMVHQHGDALDLHLGLDPAADPKRLDPVAGDVRVLLTELDGKGTAVLLRYMASDAPVVGQPRTYSSPMGRLDVADVGVLSDALVAIRRDASSWALEAAIPWSALGTTAPETAIRLRGDVGVLMSDPEGMTTVARYYWANREHVVLGDLPSETRVQPPLWGDWLFVPADLGELLLDLLED